MGTKRHPPSGRGLIESIAFDRSCSADRFVEAMEVELGEPLSPSRLVQLASDLERLSAELRTKAANHT